ncbi:EthD family reductase [Curtobacterium sp. NPDC090217]|uniref:EthD family reductase n=1 Tax=Curtobacterium sp. NPDC090217 TaxID=3363970 RepID=UPI0038053645
MTILYGPATDQAAFRRYYDDVHVPLARSMPGMTAWNLVWSDDPASPYPLVAELVTATAADMDAMLDSPEGRAANADLANFVTGEVVFLRGDVEPVALA